MAAATDAVTDLLQAWTQGDQDALEKLVPAVNFELRRLARHHMRRERANHTLQTTALVNEAYLRLIGETRVDWQSRAHFYGIAARLMRQILVDHARRRNRAKRGGGVTLIALEDLSGLENALGKRGEAFDVLAIDEALGKLAGIDGRKARVVELRFFGALTVEETAAVLSVSPATVLNDWAFARAWLYRALTTKP
jgi:RNA polymerase sigma factor (TIGR02999 family)